MRCIRRNRRRLLDEPPGVAGPIRIVGSPTRLLGRPLLELWKAKTSPNQTSAERAEEGRRRRFAALPNLIGLLLALLAGIGKG